MNDQLQIQIRTILLTEWDPMGVGANPKLTNEYDDYIMEILQLIEEGCGYEGIFEHIVEIEKELGVELPQSQREKTVRSLVKLSSKSGL